MSYSYEPSQIGEFGLHRIHFELSDLTLSTPKKLPKVPRSKSAAKVARPRFGLVSMIGDVRVYLKPRQIFEKFLVEEKRTRLDEIGNSRVEFVAVISTVEPHEVEKWHGLKQLQIKSDTFYAKFLEHGTRKMAPRPFVE
ncbi:MAG: hypothetical protein IJ685_09465 [Selenomonadaceae bacterium]|nr:hypothetical protein [Selenomonadaceae bacterium]